MLQLRGVLDIEGKTSNPLQTDVFRFGGEILVNFPIHTVLHIGEGQWATIKTRGNYTDTGSFCSSTLSSVQVQDADSFKLGQRVLRRARANRPKPTRPGYDGSGRSWRDRLTSYVAESQGGFGGVTCHS